jgi:hypothetical protein
VSDHILMTAMFAKGLFGKQVTKEGSWEVSIGGGAFKASNVKGQPGVGFVNLPPAPRPLPLKIRLKSTTKHHWDIEGEFEYQGNAKLLTKSAPDEFESPRGLSQPGHHVVFLVGFLSRVREVTPPALGELKLTPSGLREDRTLPKKDWGKWHPIANEVVQHPARPQPFDAWDTPALNVRFADNPPISSTNVRVVQRSINPDTVDLVLEVASVPAPKMIAVSWPKALTRTTTSAATPFLIYFHPGVGQNVKAGFYEGNHQKPYPLGWDYLYYGLWRYVNYDGDPFTQNPFCKGLPYQIAASGKNVVLVLPMNKVGIEAGSMVNAPAAEELLEEINGFMFRRARVFTPPQLGLVAVGAFSSGVALLQSLLASAKNTGRLATMKEAYLFDRSFGNVAPNKAAVGAVDSAIAWAGTDASKKVRVYSQLDGQKVPNFQRLLGVAPGGAPSITESDDRSRTVVIIPKQTWGPAVNEGGTHQFISAIMLTDALRRSSF